MIRCIGCNKAISRKPYAVDDNGETGCPACFTEDGSGECWHSDAIERGAPFKPTTADGEA